MFYILQVIRYFIMTNLLMSGPRKLHEKMAYKIMRAPQSFFDRNPSGRILNRFSSDIGIIDTTLFDTIVTIVDTFGNSLMALIIVCMLSYPLLIAAVIVIFIVYKVALRFYVPLSRCKQLESVTRSPMYSYFSSTLSGLIVIRCYHQARMFLKKFFDLVNINAKAQHSFYQINRSLGYSIDFL